MLTSPYAAESVIVSAGAPIVRKRNSAATERCLRRHHRRYFQPRRHFQLRVGGHACQREWQLASGSGAANLYWLLVMGDRQITREALLIRATWESNAPVFSPDGEYVALRGDF